MSKSLHLERDEEARRLDTVVPSINVVAHEKVVGVRHVAADAEQLCFGETYNRHMMQIGNVWDGEPRAKAVEETGGTQESGARAGGAAALRCVRAHP